MVYKQQKSISPIPEAGKSKSKALVAPVSGEGFPPGSRTAVCWLGPCGAEGARGGFSKAANPIQGLLSSPRPHLLIRSHQGLRRQRFNVGRTQSVDGRDHQIFQPPNTQIEIQIHFVYAVSHPQWFHCVASTAALRAASGLLENATQQLTPTPTCCWLHKALMILWPWLHGLCAALQRGMSPQNGQREWELPSKWQEALYLAKYSVHAGRVVLSALLSTVNFEKAWKTTLSGSTPYHLLIP